MTRDRDIERVLETWLGDGSSEMPDRLFDAVVDRIDHVPQRRMARIKLWLSTLDRSVRIAAAMAAVVVVAVVGFAVMGHPASSGVARPSSPAASTPAPSMAPSPSAPGEIECNQLFFEAIKCAGNLEPGVHTSTNFPYQVTYTVPAGWAVSWDTSKSYSLEKQADVINEGSFRSTNLGPTIYVFPDPEPAIQDGSCTVATQPGIGSSPDALASWVANRPGIVASKPTSIAIGGLTGQVVDVQVASTWSRLCGTLDGHGDRQAIAVPYIALVRGVGSGGGPTDRWEWGPNRPERQRYIFLAIGGGRSVAIVADATLPVDFDRLVADAAPIIQSMTFTP